jgi:hypothetical protein
MFCSFYGGKFLKHTVMVLLSRPRCLVLAYLPLFTRFAGLNAAEDNGFLRAIKIHSTPSHGAK